MSADRPATQVWTCAMVHDLLDKLPMSTSRRSGNHSSPTIKNVRQTINAYVKNRNLLVHLANCPRPVSLTTEHNKL